MADAESSPNQLQRFSCLTCRQRKVKCDRRDPCSNCVRACQECCFVAPVRGKRKRTKPVQEGLHAKLRRYEEILKSHGATVDDHIADEKAQSPSVSVAHSVFDAATERSQSLLPTTVPLEPAQSPSPLSLHPPLSFHQSSPRNSRPKLIKSKETSRHFDYSAWSNASIADHLPKCPKENENFPDDSSDEESDLLLGYGASLTTQIPLTRQHPTSNMALKMFDIYADRVDPMIKTLHLPTFRIALMDAVRQPESAAKGLQALIFAFYLITVQSLTDNECQSLLNEKKMSLFKRFRRAACQALRSAKYMQACDLTILRAYLLYILAVRSTHTTDTFHVLTGIAVRLACKMGLQNDGTSLGLSPFETEMRRRVWWPIMQLDLRTSGIIGAKPSLDLFVGDTKQPLNVPDEHLFPDMMDFPPEVSGITSACILLLRCEVFSCVCKLHPESAEIGSRRHDAVNRNEAPDSSHTNVTRRDSIIQELNSSLETKFLRYCDPTKPLHLLVLMMARSSVCVGKIKFGNEAIRRYTERGAAVPESERDAVFAAATKMLELFRITLRNTDLDKYLWQAGVSILWNAVLWVLIEVRRRKIGRDVDKAWDLVDGVLSNPLPTFQKTKSVVYKVLENWALEAWDTCVRAREERGLEHVTPEWINTIRKSREPASSSSNKEDLGDVLPTDNSETWNSDGRTPFSSEEAFDAYSFSDLLNFELAPAEWSQWESLVAHEEVGGF